MAEWARTARRAAGYTSAEKAARDLGLDAGYLRGLEAGHIGRPKPERLAKLEALYGSKAPEPEVEEPASLEGVIDALDRIAVELGHLRGVHAALSDHVGLVLGALAPGAVDALLRQEARSETDTR